MGGKARDPRAGDLYPVCTIFGHGLCILCHHRIQLFLPVLYIATVMSRVSIVTCYGIRVKTYAASRTRPFAAIPVAFPLNNLFWQRFVRYKALAVP